MIDMFKNKRVALIGNAKSLVYSDYGELIDSHDIVCRINKGYYMLPPFNDMYYKSHGSKIDVLFLNLIKTSGLTERFNNLTKIIQTGSTIVQEEHKLLIDSTILKTDLDIINSYFTQKPSTGIRALWMIANQSDAAEISVFGFDWKKTPSFWHLRHDKSAYEHDFEEEKKFCETNFLTNNKIKFYLSPEEPLND